MLFHIVGFDKTKVFIVQGYYGKNQCGKGFGKILYHNEKLIQEMVLAQKDCMVPTSLVPRCLICGGLITANLRADEFFLRMKNENNRILIIHNF